MFIPYSAWDQCAVVTDFEERCWNISYEKPLDPKDQLDCKMSCRMSQRRLSTLRNELSYLACPQQSKVLFRDQSQFFGGDNLPHLYTGGLFALSAVEKCRYFCHKRLSMNEWMELWFYFYCWTPQEHSLSPSAALIYSLGDDNGVGSLTLMVWSCFTAGRER